MYYRRKSDTSDNQEIKFETLSHDSLGYGIQLLRAEEEAEIDTQSRK